MGNRFACSIARTLQENRQKMPGSSVKRTFELRHNRLIYNMEPMVGIERFVLLFVSGILQEIADSQDYSASTRLLPEPTCSLLAD